MPRDTPHKMHVQAGRTLFLMLAAHEVAAVRAAVERYRAALATLEAEGEAGRAALARRLGTGRGKG